MGDYYINRWDLLDKVQFMDDYNIDMYYVTLDDIMSLPTVDIRQDKYEIILKNMYRVCMALVDIVDEEMVTYGHNDVVRMAEDYISEYEEDHPDEHER